MPRLGTLRPAPRLRNARRPRQRGLETPHLQMGSRGFHPVRQKTTNAINVSDLVLQLDRLMEEGSAKQAGNMVEVDLGKAGYQKLLGNGVINQPLRIIVAKTSERAQEKIGRAGGEIVLPTKNKQD